MSPLALSAAGICIGDERGRNICVFFPRQERALPFCHPRSHAAREKTSSSSSSSSSFAVARGWKEGDPSFLASYFHGDRLA